MTSKEVNCINEHDIHSYLWHNQLNNTGQQLNTYMIITIFINQSSGIIMHQLSVQWIITLIYNSTIGIHFKSINSWIHIIATHLFIYRSFM